MPGKEDDIDWGDEPVQPEIKEDPIIYSDILIKVDFKWQECRTDPINYRPYSPLIIPENIRIRIPVPINLIESYELLEGTTDIATECTLSLAGYTYCQKMLARAIKQAFIQ